MTFPELRIGNLVTSLPIIQGGMGVGISMANLAAAVANQGGIGVIAGAMAGITEKDVAKNPAEANARALKREIRKAREMTTGIIGVNIMVALTHYPEQVRASIEEGVDVIFSGAGLPLDLPGFLTKGSQTKLVPIVSSGRAATLIARKWQAKYNYLPDAFVVEGPKAGGHLGFKPEQLDDPKFALENLVADVIAAVEPFISKYGKNIPVIAAGGVYNGRDILSFLQMGAGGVQMGTRFVATYECDADPAFKEAIIKAGKDDLVVIKSPVGMPGRAVKNTFLEKVAKGEKRPFTCPYHCVKTCKQEKSPYCIALALASARKGKFKNGYAFAGSNAYRVDKLMSVKDLLSSLEKEYCQALEEVSVNAA